MTEAEKIRQAIYRIVKAMSKSQLELLLEDLKEYEHHQGTIHDHLPISTPKIIV